MSLEDRYNNLQRHYVKLNYFRQVLKGIQIVSGLFTFGGAVAAGIGENLDDVHTVVQVMIWISVTCFALNQTSTHL